MFLVVFIKKRLMKHLTRVNSVRCAKGKNVVVTVVGNKGGLCYSFSLFDRLFNIFGTHLQHKREKQEKRNYMSREVVNQVKIQQIQEMVPGLEADQLGDFNFFVGDLNYRLKTYYTDLNDTNVKKDAIAMIPTHD